MGQNVATIGDPTVATGLMLWSRLQEQGLAFRSFVTEPVI